MLALLAWGCGEDAAGSANNAPPSEEASCDFDVPLLGDAPNRAVLKLAVSSDGLRVVFADSAGVTLVGLADGAEQSWTPQDSALASAETAALLIDDTNALWVGHGTAICDGTAQGRCGLSILDAGAQDWRVLCVENQPDLLDDRVLALGQASDGQIWVGTASGATRTSDGQGFLPYFDWQDCLNPGQRCDPLFSFSVADLAFGDADVWLAIEQQAIGVSPKPGGVARRLEDGRTDTWDRDQGLPSNRAALVAITASGQAWAGRLYGAAVLNAEDNTWRLDFEEPIIDMAAHGDDLWVITEAGTVHRKDPQGQWSAIEGLPGNATAVAAGGDMVCVGSDAILACYNTDTCRWSAH